jgi:tRNA threonylcarbamoyladenosine biosynthesis protein TsaB
MLILAIDTALDACSATLFDTDLDQPLAIASLDIGRGHAEALLPLVESVMNDARVGFDAVDRIVATVGPGSFTGLRVGLAAARGFALTCGKTVVGVTTLAAFTAPYITANEAVPVIAAIDAKHGNLYLQMVGAGGRMLVAPRVSNLRDAVRTVALGPTRIVGSGAAMLAAHWPSSAMVRPPLLVDPRPAPDVTWVARLGAAADPAWAKPSPLYLRQPDARPQTAHQLPRR